MNELTQLIINRIKKAGPIPFETFMDMALYYPDIGYYSSPETFIGKEGDFYTSPHLHAIFGAMIGRQFMEMWEAMGKPASFHAIEIGAGYGYVCKDIFDYLLTLINNPDLSDFHSALKYVIVEPFPHFEQKQKETLKDHIGSPPPNIIENRKLNEIKWVGSLKELNNVEGCVFSNELLDAFPVHLIEMGSTLKEVYINIDGGDLIEEKKDISTSEISDYLGTFSIAPDSGYRTEINLRIRDWLRDVSSVLSHGFILTIDYGYSAAEYYNEDRSNGTLLCYHQHLYNENPYQHVGEQDITAHVNFSSVKMWGEELGFKTLGYCPQGTYLISSGIDEVITELYVDSPDYLSEVSKIKGLIMPQGMGESHNVLIQYKGKRSPHLKGLLMRNLKGNL
jgi:SAM-dependent MidA family methyltransferase